ncbi:transglycosylase SLT domain-containing protein [Methylotenera sp. L2L1]|uniref:transglycosylase SLT domain-containing protein n=1 Tax=Methylotenera sp. L2L1 TaxID=1502770 RepID=UPI000565B6B3|nr:transglycosylase SLT domain-containing protein [Methylotenera sp. L2L1]
MFSFFTKRLDLFPSRYIRQLWLAALLLSGNVAAMSDQDLFEHARDAYAKRNELALAEDVSQLNDQQYILAPYAAYWLMLLRLDQADSAEVDAFITQYADMAFVDRLRGEWLKKLGKKQEWTLFLEHYPHFKRADTAVECYALYGKSQLEHQDVAAQVKRIWLSSADLPSSCTPLFDAMQQAGALSNSDIWARLRLALHDGKLNVAKSIIARLPSFDKNNLELLDVANQTPKLLLTNKTVNVKINNKKAVLKTPSFKAKDDIEVNLYALDVLARSNIDDAVAVNLQIQQQWSAPDAAFAWGRIAYHAARNHHPQALEYYAKAHEVSLDKEQLAWMARAAMRAQNWDVLLDAIGRMSAEQQQEGAWRYWKGRALKEKAVLVEANKILGPLSTERHYYGWLALEELGSVVNSPQLQYTPTELEVTAIASQPAIKRAFELQKLDMRWEAKAEWVWATRDFDDKQLLAAAEYAQRQKWYDVAISTADNTKQLHDFNLRYPIPYRDLFRAAAVNENVDEAWIYGLTRQESRFMHYAKSGVGASGLMQLMPATAKWAAQRMGLSDYSHEMIHDLKFNVGIGTYYMRYTLEVMNGQAVMATAAYNAGPSRARRWVADEPLEAAIYVETIPFGETRSYVQKVMANAQIYAPRLGLPVQSLKARMGTVPGRIKSEVILADVE